MLICRTPFRLSFYGGGLDYPEWYNYNKINVLNAALGYYCYQTVRELPPFFNHNYRAAYSTIELANHINDIKHPSIRECIRRFAPTKNIEITHVGDLPARSGIGSSSAFTVGMINALHALSGKHIGKAELAQLAIDTEQINMGENVGIQDQCAAAFGGVILTKADYNSISPRRFISQKSYLDYISDSLLMGFNGRERFSSVGSLHTSDSIRLGRNNDLLEKLSFLSDEGIKAFSSEADISLHAKITKQCRDIKLHLNGDHNNDEINTLIERTERAGSLCTRIMGAGRGGFLLCWAPRIKHADIKSSVDIKTWVDVKISSSGSEIIYYE